MGELDKLGQSDGDDAVDGGQDKRSFLLSEKIRITITCLCPPTGAAPRFHPYQHYGYNENNEFVSAMRETISACFMP